MKKFRYVLQYTTHTGGKKTSEYFGKFKRLKKRFKTFNPKDHDSVVLMDTQTMQIIEPKEIRLI